MNEKRCNGSVKVVVVACIVLASHSLNVYGAPQDKLPHLRKQGTATQLVADGKPFLVTFETEIPGNDNVGILSVQEGRYKNGEWTPGRWLNGDQTHQGRHLRLSPGRFDIQRIKLYRYR
jgi:hypothetical protein